MIYGTYICTMFVEINYLTVNVLRLRISMGGKVFLNDMRSHYQNLASKIARINAPYHYFNVSIG